MTLYMYLLITDTDAILYLFTGSLNEKEVFL